MKSLNLSLAIVVTGLISLSACDRPPVDASQRGYRGMGLVQFSNPRARAADLEINRKPDPAPPTALEGPTAAETQQNVQVLGDVPVGEFMRLMGAMTAWVSPDEGCLYCHDSADLALDTVYQKQVARHMLQMVRDINTNWKAHVGDTGVTCYTCHRGMNVPSVTWTFDSSDSTGPMMGTRAGQNAPSEVVGLTSLPHAPFQDYLYGDEKIRVQTMTPLPSGNRTSIKQTERTYGFMVHISESLGVNCGFCHNTNSFIQWTPTRVKAWHAIQMVHHLNKDYLGPLADIVPAHRKGPGGDAFKVNCATCHRGLSKPLEGFNMTQDYPELRGVIPPQAAPPTAEPVADPATAAPMEAVIAS